MPRSTLRGTLLESSLAQGLPELLTLCETRSSKEEHSSTPSEERREMGVNGRGTGGPLSEGCLSMTLGFIALLIAGIVALFAL